MLLRQGALENVTQRLLESSYCSLLSTAVLGLRGKVLVAGELQRRLL